MATTVHPIRMPSKRPKTPLGALRDVSACDLRHVCADAVEGRLSTVSAMDGRYSATPTPQPHALRAKSCLATASPQLKDNG